MNLPDLRPQLAASQEWIAALIDGVSPDQLSSQTPCAEYDVRGLIEHLLAVELRVQRIGESGDIGDAPSELPLPEGDLAAAFRSAAADAAAAWRDDERLTATVTPPFGTMPGAAALGGYISEHVTHGWDLATATGQNAEADPALAAVAMGAMEKALPDGPREGLPFAPAVEPAADAGPTERLANWTGRRSR
ncbi:TIGR03086 family protein [Epidermidibacterium keratini]|uniref:TIGR03086 family protein n=1 Tax=Epidermidibacterium keratini TaxID=1891644 RepID=A0A7L4YNI5_9ACTN|nr:TIGR03086 family metal-binding protein [Epidermidibacterium keratini]QHC00107.1 TIGR03086 family protein [Epidermidibacterium keratini]